VKTFLAHKRLLTVVAVLAIAAVTAMCCRASLAVYYSLYLEIACTEGDSPPRSFDIEDLLLDESAFPEGWRAREPFNPEVRLPAEQVALGFFRDRCPEYSVGAGHDVYRFWGGARCADLGFGYKTRIWFAPWSGYGPWSAPTDLSYQSPLADRFVLECCISQRSDAQVCQALGRYEEYMVRFLVHMDSEPEDPQCMSFADLERILVAIDERMAQYLGEGDGAPMD